MLPVLAMRVRPGDAVLDSCASPGSKTMQLMEARPAPQQTPSICAALALLTPLVNPGSRLSRW